MDVFEAIETRRTVHMYRASEISEDLLKQALQAALLAPNHKLTCPWKFLIAGPQTRATLLEMTKELDRKKKEGAWTPEDEARLDKKLLEKVVHPAALVIFCCARTDDAFRQREDYATVCCSIQNFCLALTAGGYGTKWSTGGVTRAAQTYDVLGLDPQAFEIIGFVWVGKAHGPVAMPKRPPLEEVLETLP